MYPCVQNGPCREWIWWCRPHLGQCHGTAAPWDPGDTKEENPRPATPLTSVVSASGLPVRGLKLTFWRFHFILSLFPGYEPCFGGRASDWSPFHSGVQSGPRLANSQMRIRDKTNTRAHCGNHSCTHPLQLNATQRVSWPPSSPPTSPSLPAPPWPASSPPRRPRFPVRSAAARHDRVSIFCCKLHPPERTVGYRLKPSGPWWSVTRGNARVVDRLADLTPPVPVPNRSQACPGGEGCVREGCRQVSRAPVEDPPTPID